MRLRRVALVWDLEAAPWAPIMLGFVEGLRAHGVAVHVAPSAPDWCSAENLRQLDVDAVIVGVHQKLTQHVPLLVDAIGRACAWVALCFDDPYDMATTLELGRFFDLLLTPEACAVDTYERRGWRADVIAPTVCSSWHHPPTAAVDQVHDVLHVGGNQWKPRREWLPQLAKSLQAVGRQLTQATGGRLGWLAGRRLTQELHRARLTIDLPRDEWFNTNPHAVPCTYTGPRVHLAAACGVPCLCINPRGDLAMTYPDAPTATLEDGIGRVLQLLEQPDQLRAIAAANLAQFQRAHAPAIRARQLIDLVELHCLGERTRIG